MNEKRGILLNALMSTLQVVVTGATFLLFYRFLLDSIGAELAGVWALVLAWTAAISAADLGLTGGAVKFVSKYRARMDEDRVVQVVETSVLTVAIVLLALLPAVYPLFSTLLRVIVEPSMHIPEALSVLPYAVVSFWLTSVGGIVLSCIDGTRRVYLRNVIVMASALLYFGLALLLVPRAGLIGLAQAQVIQAAIVLAAAWIVLRTLIPSLPLLPLRWRKAVFKEMFGYSVNFQLVSLSQLLFQPVTKSLISKFGGVGPVFYFEMAHKLVLQLRALIVMAHQSLVPTIAHAFETSRDRVQDIYRKSFRLLLFIIAASLPLLIGLTPIISHLWIGAYEPTFVLFAMLLFLAWFLNMLVNPAYFGYVGIGRMRWNVVAHLIIGIVNLGLGIWLGLQHGGSGVVVGYSIAVVTGSAVPIFAYHTEYGIRWGDLVERFTAYVFLASLCGLALMYAVQDAVRDLLNPWLVALLLPIAYLLTIALPVWKHPIKRMLQQWIQDAFSGRETSHRVASSNASSSPPSI